MKKFITIAMIALVAVFISCSVITATNSSPKDVRVRIYNKEVKTIKIHIITVSWKQTSDADTICVIKVRPITDGPNYDITDCQNESSNEHDRYYIYSNESEVSPAYKYIEGDVYFIEEYKDDIKLSRYGPYIAQFVTHIPQISR